MDSNFLDGGEVDVRTVSYDNPEEVASVSREPQETIYGRLSRWFICVGVFVLPLFIILLVASDSALLEKVKLWKKTETKSLRLAGGIAMIILGIIIFTL